MQVERLLRKSSAIFKAAQKIQLLLESVEAVGDSVDVRSSSSLGEEDTGVPTCTWPLALCVFVSKRHAEQISLCVCCPFSLTDTLTVWKNTVVDLFQTASWIAFYYFQLLLKGLVLVGKVQDWFHCKTVPFLHKMALLATWDFPFIILKMGLSLVLGGSKDLLLHA